MAQKTSYLGLNTYNLIEDASVGMNVIIENTAGASASANPKILDTYASQSSASILNLSASTVILTASYIALKNQVFGTTITSASYNIVEVDTYGKVISGSVTRVGTGNTLLTNKSGTNLPKGAIGIYSTASPSCFVLTTIESDDRLCGVLTEEVANNNTGVFAKSGNIYVYVSGCVTAGNWLIVSSTSGCAKDSGSSVKPPVGCVGIALETRVATSGSITAYVMI
jgi:hypothetical protein